MNQFDVTEDSRQHLMTNEANFHVCVKSYSETKNLCSHIKLFMSSARCVTVLHERWTPGISISDRFPSNLDEKKALIEASDPTWPSVISSRGSMA